MQARDQTTGGSSGDADGPGGPDVPGGPGGNAGGPGEAGAAGGRAPQGSGAARASGPEGGDPQGPSGGGASAQNGSCPFGARGPDSRLLQFHITMPFLSPMEAELARTILARDAAQLPRPGEVLKDFTVSGNLLVMSVREEDRDRAGLDGGGLGSASHPHPHAPRGARGDGCRAVAFNVMFFAPRV
uniref:Uncharacterized protein n=1 Tax=Saimiri boliviensis boliviensis TaxID=39432 RepID=A0A2K6UH01_SAIBB